MRRGTTQWKVNSAGKLSKMFGGSRLGNTRTGTQWRSTSFAHIPVALVEWSINHHKRPNVSGYGCQHHLERLAGLNLVTEDHKMFRQWRGRPRDIPGFTNRLLTCRLKSPLSARNPVLSIGLRHAVKVNFMGSSGVRWILNRWKHR